MQRLRLSRMRSRRECPTCRVQARNTRLLACPNCGHKYAAPAARTPLGARGSRLQVVQQRARLRSSAAPGPFEDLGRGEPAPVAVDPVAEPLAERGQVAGRDPSPLGPPGRARPRATAGRRSRCRGCRWGSSRRRRPTSARPGALRGRRRGRRARGSRGSARSRPRAGPSSSSSSSKISSSSSKRIRMWRL